ncbi:MAG: WD40 repeat domain-containing protein [Terriglobia bacterium]
MSKSLFLVRCPLSVVGIVFAVLLLQRSLAAQVETVEGPRTEYHWVSHGRIEGHLAISYSPAGAFSPDSSTLAVVSDEKVALMDLRRGSAPKILRPRLENITDLIIQSANFVTPDRLLILASGLVKMKDKGMAPRTPELAFQWDTVKDAVSGKINALGSGGGFGPTRYFPDIRYIGLNKDNNFDLWEPLAGKGGRITIPSLTQPANLYAFSPDGHWLLLAQIAGGGTTDPTVASMNTKQFVDALRGHQGTVLGIAFSRDDTRVVTACEDGKVRIWSVGDWKLLQTLSGHFGPVHWAEFSADGRWIASAGEDKTVRIWSAQDGKAVAELRESQAPVLSVAFSPNGQYLSATTEKTVLVWERQ